MSPNYPHDYIQRYEAGIEALKVQPSDRNIQHEVVLALARVGALDFALAEYNRYGLAAVRDHEDIMALNGRLSKDLYLRSSGKQALQYAQAAAQKYELAFENTLGYYSGINSATMAFMAGQPAERIVTRIEAIEALLPVSRDLTPTDHYFIEATRAECFLLKGARAQAAAALHRAIDFDPLNYTAHASTLKQFMMISSKQGGSLEWLSDFRPPRPMHFAGHIRLNLTPAEQDVLKISISDALQQEDVGFGFGALAAGGDILFAEALLEQGAELHVVLPCPVDMFRMQSVIPFGEDWADRFDDCLSRAASLRIVSGSTNWPNQKVNRLSGLSAMGHAVLQGQSLSAAPVQMLILNESEGQSYTATHAQDWFETGHAQFRLTSGAYQTVNFSTSETREPVAFAIKKTEPDEFETHKDVVSSVESIVSNYDGGRIALHLHITDENAEVILDNILASGAPQSLLASEAFASVLAAIGGNGFDITYAGQAKNGASDPVRCYMIQSTSGSTYTLP